MAIHRHVPPVSQLHERSISIALLTKSCIHPKRATVVNTLRTREWGETPSDRQPKPARLKMIVNGLEGTTTYCLANTR
jgi:hypothetical protein